MPETFHASVQYNDWRGQVAADDHDKRHLREYLRTQGHLTDDEFLVGVTAWVGEDRGEKPRVATVYALVADARGYENMQVFMEQADPLPLKQIRIEIPIEEFIGFFKRFEIALEWRGVGLLGREYDTET